MVKVVAVICRYKEEVEICKHMEVEVREMVEVEIYRHMEEVVMVKVVGVICRCKAEEVKEMEVGICKHTVVKVR